MDGGWTEPLGWTGGSFKNGGDVSERHMCMSQKLSINSAVDAPTTMVIMMRMITATITTVLAL